MSSRHLHLSNYTLASHNLLDGVFDIFKLGYFYRQATLPVFCNLKLFTYSQTGNIILTDVPFTCSILSYQSGTGPEGLPHSAILLDFFYDHFTFTPFILLRIPFYFLSYTIYCIIYCTINCNILYNIQCTV